MFDPPIIEKPSLIPVIRCSCCGSTGATAGLKSFGIRTSQNSRQIFVVCKECAEKIAMYLLRAWSEQATERKQSSPRYSVDVHRDSRGEYSLYNLWDSEEVKYIPLNGDSHRGDGYTRSKVYAEQMCNKMNERWEESLENT